ncbi:MAG: carboxypeptidase regulatory-like domain-containing protein, partial [Longimicrobiales bacterium]
MIERRRGRQWLTGVALLLAFGGAELEAQSITSAGVSGTVRGSDGSPVAQALVTLSAVSGSRSDQSTTTSAGGFAFSLIQPGSYELRVEALGYRPLVARPLTLSVGENRALTLTLTVEPPPVTRVDTIALPAGASSRARAGALQFGAHEISQLPYRFNDLGGVASLSTSFDRGLGAQGLPGDMTLVLADGLPVYRAPHPTARGEILASPLFSTSSLASVASMYDATDVEWSGSAGGYLVTTTRNSTGSGGAEIDAGWSGDPLWSSAELDVVSPSLMSFQGGARGTLAVGNSGTLFVSGEALQHESPLAPRVGEALATDLTGLDPTVLEGLSQPGVESYRRYAGLARLDVQRSSSSRLFLRGAGAVSERSFDGSGPLTLRGLSAPAEESIDFSAALGLVSAPSRRTTLELRGGVSGSYRDFSGSGIGLPPAYLTESATFLGQAHSSVGESSRTDFVLNPLLRYGVGSNSSLKFGATVRASRHTMAHSRSSLGDALFSGPSEVLSGEGFGQRTNAAEESFGTQEFGVFAQYEGMPSSNVRLVLGGRYDFERITAGDAALNDGWFDATGLRSDDFDTGYHQFGARFSLGWDPGGTGSTRVMIGASLHEGDVDTRAIYQVLAEDVDGTSTRYSGSSLGWPEGGIPALAGPDLPSLTLLGPDARAPRTSNLSVTLSQRVGDRTSAFAGASTRRTDFLMRRRNLNLPLVPLAADSWGRSVYGTPVQTGGTVVTTADDARRFADFGEVWALDPDGWSEYVGVTVGLEHSTALLEAFATYTWSETTDNWVGAASGRVGASLEPGLLGEGDTPCADGVSDFDRPHRAVGA